MKIRFKHKVSQLKEDIPSGWLDFIPEWSIMVEGEIITEEPGHIMLQWRSDSQQPLSDIQGREVERHALRAAIADLERALLRLG